MSSKFDSIYNSVLAENTTPAPQPNPNIAKEVQDFFTKHQSTAGFFDVLAKQIEAVQKAQQQAAKQQPAPPQQPNNQQPAQQNNQQQPAQQQNNQQQGQPQNQQQNPQQQNQQQRK